MSDKIIVQPQVVDGVEFYVSSETNETGMSISGLSRLCGVETASMSQMLQLVDGGNTKAELLKRFTGKVFNVNLVRMSPGNHGAIVSGEVCASVIEYYAYESRSKNKHIAQHTFRKFAAKGIDNWIKEITGCVQSQDNKAILSVLQSVLGQLQTLNNKVEKLEVTATKHENLRGATFANFPRLDEMLEGFEKSDRILPQAEDELTLVQWLQSKGITFDANAKMRFGNLVSGTFQSLTGERPKKARCKDKYGKFTEKQNVYAPRHFPMLEIALKRMF